MLLSRSQRDAADTSGGTPCSKGANAVAVPPLRLDNLSSLLEEANAQQKKEREQAFQEAKERAEAHARQMGIAPVDPRSGTDPRAGLQAQLQMLTALCSRPAGSAAAGAAASTSISRATS